MVYFSFQVVTNVPIVMNATARAIIIAMFIHIVSGTFVIIDALSPSEKYVKGSTFEIVCR